MSEVERLPVRRTLFLIAFFISFGSADGQVSSLEQDATNACGPIAVYTALHSLGLSDRFDDVVNALKWRRGDTVSLGQLIAYLTVRKDLAAQSGILDASSLQFALQRGEVAIVAVRRRSGTTPDHAEVVIDGGGGEAVLLDYPYQPIRLEYSSLKSVWSGETIVLSKASKRDNGVDRYIGAATAFIVGGTLGLFLVARAKLRSA